MRIRIKQKYIEKYKIEVRMGWNLLQHIDDSIGWKLVNDGHDRGEYFEIYEHPTDARFKKHIMFFSIGKKAKEQVLYKKDMTEPTPQSSFVWGTPPELEGMPAVIIFYPNGQLYSEHYIKGKDSASYMHDLDNPSIVDYYKNGKKEAEHWFTNNEPKVCIRYTPDGQVEQYLTY
jgi:hypothetical protein